MAITIVQSLARAGANSVASLQSSAFGSPVTAGNTIIVQAGGYSNNVQTGPLAFADTSGNVYAPDGGHAKNGTFPNPGVDIWSGIWRITNCLGGSNFKLTFATNNGTSYVNFTAIEVSGLAASPLDGAGSGNHGTITTATTGAFSTANANDLIVGVLDTDSSTASAPTGTPTNFIKIVSGFVVSGEGFEADYWLPNATQSGLNPAWTVPAGNAWSAFALAYKAAVNIPVSWELWTPMMGSLGGNAI